MINKAVLGEIAKLVPVAVGALLAWLAATLGIVVGPSSEAGLVALCVAVLTAGWYALVKVVEREWPWTAVLIGDSPAAAQDAKIARKLAV